MAASLPRRRGSSAPPRSQKAAPGDGRRGHRRALACAAARLAPGGPDTRWRVVRLAELRDDRETIEREWPPLLAAWAEADPGFEVAQEARAGCAAPTLTAPLR
jgi:hypothetical protein